MTAASECIWIPPAELVGRDSVEPLVRIDTDPDVDPDADRRGRKPEAPGRLVRTLAPPEAGHGGVGPSVEPLLGVGIGIGIGIERG